MRTALVAVTAVTQFVLHYLSIGAALLAAVALVFGNLSRAGELALSAFGLFVLKFAIGFVVVTAIGRGQREPAGPSEARP